MAFVGISLGSNLGDRFENLRTAVSKLRKLSVGDHLLLSSVYETEPVACPPDSPKFLNAVIEIETDLAPETLLRETQAIERNLGRPDQRAINAPRPVDIDLLYYDGLALNAEDLTLPHPRMNEREFVIRPLREIQPSLVSESQLEAVVDPDYPVRVAAGPERLCE